MVASEWDDVSYVISSRYRIATLKRLSDSPATPSRIAEDTDLSVAHVSRALQELRDHELTELLVSEDRKKGRVYGITDHGGAVWETIEAENMI
ncbi:winged helix-turn-helix domain-containing protein [Halobacteria archaeon HArc-gm2]|nr:winged helix-turn-helix domain-containing protein [Halobacteria archaeon HArc-gm2]